MILVLASGHSGNCVGRDGGGAFQNPLYAPTMCDTVDHMKGHTANSIPLRVRVNEVTKEQLIKISDEDQIDLSDVVRRALREYLERHAETKSTRPAPKRVTKAGT